MRLKANYILISSTHVKCYQADWCTSRAIAQSAALPSFSLADEDLAVILQLEVKAVFASLSLPCTEETKTKHHLLVKYKLQGTPSVSISKVWALNCMSTAPIAAKEHVFKGMFWSSFRQMKNIGNGNLPVIKTTSKHVTRYCFRSSQLFIQWVREAQGAGKSTCLLLLFCVSASFPRVWLLLGI